MCDIGELIFFSNFSLKISQLSFLSLLLSHFEADFKFGVRGGGYSEDIFWKLILSFALSSL